jgi:hypothetical protein
MGGAEFVLSVTSPARHRRYLIPTIKKGRSVMVAKAREVLQRTLVDAVRNGQAPAGG